MAQPYLTAAVDDKGIRILPLVTVPEAAPNGYRMAGVPDGIGAYASTTQPDTFYVLLTHEFRFNQGGRRPHAGSGAFVSKWTFDTSGWKGGKGSLKLISGEDLIKTINHWDHAAGKHRESIRVPLERLCSADLPVPSALHFTDKNGGEWGTKERLFLGGEETHTKYKPVFGRAFAGHPRAAARALHPPRDRGAAAWNLAFRKLTTPVESPHVQIQLYPPPRRPVPPRACAGEHGPGGPARQGMGVDCVAPRRRVAA